MPVSKKKFNLFKKRLKEKDIDIAMFLCLGPIHDFNIQYFTDFPQEKGFSFSCLLIDNKRILFVSKLDYDRAKTYNIEKIICLDKKRHLHNYLKDKLKPKMKVGIVENIFPYSFVKKYRQVKFVDISDILLEIRAIKEEQEINRIKKACKIANHGIKIIQENLSTKIRERELAFLLEKEMIKKGADELSFPTIITSGSRSIHIHPYPSFSDKKIKKGLGLVDFGVRYKGYCSDVTLPFSIGRLSEKQKKIVKTVEDAYEKSIDALEIGKPTWQIYEVAKNIIEKNGFEFKHALGHGLGIELHDVPSFSPKPEDKMQLKEWKEIKLEKNMIFTIEPGVYTKYGGCRIENDILMDKKPKILTRSKFFEL